MTQGHLPPRSVHAFWGWHQVPSRLHCTASILPMHASLCKVLDHQHNMTAASRCHPLLLPSLPSLLLLQVASAPPQVPIQDASFDSTCNVVVATPPLVRCHSPEYHAPKMTAAADTSSSPHTATNSSAGEGPATSSRCSKKTVLHGSQILVVGGMGDGGCGVE